MENVDRFERRRLLYEAQQGTDAESRASLLALQQHLDRLEDQAARVDEGLADLDRERDALSRDGVEESVLQTLHDAVTRQNASPPERIQPSPEPVAEVTADRDALRSGQLIPGTRARRESLDRLWRARFDGRTAVRRA